MDDYHLARYRISVNAFEKSYIPLKVIDLEEGTSYFGSFEDNTKDTKKIWPCVHDFKNVPGNKDEDHSKHQIIPTLSAIENA